MKSHLLGGGSPRPTHVSDLTQNFAAGQAPLGAEEAPLQNPWGCPVWVVNFPPAGQFGHVHIKIESLSQNVLEDPDTFSLFLGHLAT